MVKNTIIPTLKRAARKIKETTISWSLTMHQIAITRPMEFTDLIWREINLR